MQKEEIVLNSLCDDLALAVTLFIPDKEILGIVQLSHGMVEDKKYYYDFMEYLTNNGYVTIINDHRGHGKSVKNIDDLGYLYEENADYIVKDLHQITTYVKKRFPKKKLILFGHSMGSLVVRKYLKKYDNEIDKLIVCGSPSINKAAKMGLLLAKMTRTIKGDRYRSKFLNKLALTNDPSNAWLSTDLDYVKRYNEDEMCGYIFTTNGFINLTNLMVDVYSQKGWNLNNLDLPILFIAGALDPVIKNIKMWQKSINFLKNVGYQNITQIIYPEMKHAILNEVEKEKVYQDIIEFIKK